MVRGHDGDMFDDEVADAMATSLNGLFKLFGDEDVFIATRPVPTDVTVLPCGCSKSPIRLNIGCQVAVDLYGPVADADLTYHELLSQEYIGISEDEHEQHLQVAQAASDAAYDDFSAHFNEPSRVIGPRT